MASWQKIITTLFVLFVLSVFTAVETAKLKRKREKGKGKNLLQGETLQQLCGNSSTKSSNNSKKNILELQAFFDLNKSFACLKVETCSRTPLCFVEDTPDLGQESLNDCTLWNLLIHGLQTNRKIEPVQVLGNRMNSLNGGKSRTDNSWDDAVSSLCHGVKHVYRFLTEDTGEEENASTNGTSTNSTTANTLNPGTTATNGSAATPVTYTRPRKYKPRRGGPFNRFLRQIRKKKIAIFNSSCGGLDGCTRICVGQNERFTNVSDCSTFKIHCTSKKLFRSRRRQKGKNKKKNSKSTE